MPNDETPAPAETVEKPVETTAQDVDKEEAFDKDRAMNTIHALREVEKKAKQDARELAALKAEKEARAQAELSETEKLKQQADRLAKENAQLQADILRRDVVAETGLPAVFADRLKGSTKAEMLEDAKEIMKAIPAQPAKPNPKVPASNPANAGNQPTDDERRAFLGLRR